MLFAKIVIILDTVSKHCPLVHRVHFNGCETLEANDKNRFVTKHLRKTLGRANFPIQSLPLAQVHFPNKPWLDINKLTTTFLS